MCQNPDEIDKHELKQHESNNVIDDDEPKELGKEFEHIQQSFLNFSMCFNKTNVI